MKTRKELLTSRNLFRAGFYITLFGAAIILLWIGIFKFTSAEAMAIKPLVEHHPLTFWVYDVFDVQTVSNVVGSVEILVAVLLLLSLRFYSLRRYAGFGVLVIFLTTISYLFSTPGTWRKIEGVPVTDFFILKDLAYLGFGFMLIGYLDNHK
ncbi:DUF417 family protein [Porphyromonas macacae]|uniref:DUF417 family protein n=1 Tax=Porphyromonas macacae TaxID=28115 RepID=UPI0024AE043F|nr:DUF417 family protein [Porphyromonas macacae]